MGDKERAREIAHAAGVPVLPGSPRYSAIDDKLLMASAARIGFPLLVKASGGGGGIGMRRVDNEEQLLQAAAATHEFASRAFASGDIYLERYISKARHIEVQVSDSATSGRCIFLSGNVQYNAAFKKS